MMLDAHLANASYLNARDFAVSEATLHIENASHATVNVSTTLTGSLSNASSVEQYGTASTAALQLQNGSHVNDQPLDTQQQ